MTLMMGALASPLQLKVNRLVLHVQQNYIIITDRNNFEDSYKLVKHFLDLTFWEYSIASFK